jgi:hypothetical protein
MKINQPLLTPTQQYYTCLCTKVSKNKGGNKAERMYNIQLMFPIQWALLKIITYIQICTHTLWTKNVPPNFRMWLHTKTMKKVYMYMCLKQCFRVMVLLNFMMSEDKSLASISLSYSEYRRIVRVWHTVPPSPCTAQHSAKNPCPPCNCSTNPP